MLDLAETLLAHQLSYTFLSKVFYEPPTTEFIQPLVDDALFDIWPIESENADIQAGLAELRAFSATWQPDDLVALKRDHARLFIGPERLLAPPWESVYRSDEHLIFERQTLEVRAQYQRFGMPIPRLHIEPDDHIGLEFRFVAYLCNMALEALERDRQDIVETVLAGLRDFLKTHLWAWAPDFLARVEDNSLTAYYRGAARLALGCLQETSAAFDTKAEKLQA
jgi:TorA maturation chaperone TorD